MSSSEDQPATVPTTSLKTQQYDFSKSPAPAPRDGIPHGFTWVDTLQDHDERKKAIMAKYGPQVRALMGPDSRIALIIPVVVALQWVNSALFGNSSWPVWLLACYLGGTFLTHPLFLAIHEVTHHTAFKTPWMNDALAIWANLGMVVPYAMVFRDYHADHHRYQGWDGLDADLPTAFELKLLDSFLGKLVFLTFQTVFYAVRPMMVRAKKFHLRHYANWIVCISFGVFWGNLFGIWPVLFMIIGIVMAGTFNPASGHFVSEHYNVKDPEGTGYQETFSYYGPWNWMCFNVGYHNEHHDFPSIPWTRLPELRRIAAEFYDPLVQTESWFGTYVHFLFNPNVGMFSRVKRERDAGARKGALVPTDVKTSAPLAELLRNAGCPLPCAPIASVPTTAVQDKKRA